MVIKSHIVRAYAPLARCLKSWHRSDQGNITWEKGRRVFQVENRKLTTDISGVHRGLAGCLWTSTAPYLPLIYEEVKICREMKCICKAEFVHTRDITAEISAVIPATSMRVP